MRLLCGDNIALLREMEDNSVDSIVTDPPYGLAFMGKRWDYDVPSVELWKECLRVLKPGGHVLAFGGTRTYHRMVTNIEDAGFEIRDQLQWIYGSGFPKSLNISKAIDKEAGAEREIVGVSTIGGGGASNSKGFKDGSGGSFQQISDGKNGLPITSPATDLAKQWDGWGTALKPANEPICLARKPIAEDTVAKNVVKWGTGGLNVDGCRIETDNRPLRIKDGTKNKSEWPGGGSSSGMSMGETVQGRWPANVLFDEEAAAMLDEQSGKLSQGHVPRTGNTISMFGPNNHAGGESNNAYGDKGGASRFFYVAKASARERGEGNGHPTVKPIKLMEYLVTLITPPSGVVLDPFMGSGTTGIAAKSAGFKFIGIEIEQEYYEIAERRCGT